MARQITLHLNLKHWKIEKLIAPISTQADSNPPLVAYSLSQSCQARYHQIRKSCLVSLPQVHEENLRALNQKWLAKAEKERAKEEKRIARERLQKEKRIASLAGREESCQRMPQEERQYQADS